MLFPPLGWLFYASIGVTFALWVHTFKTTTLFQAAVIGAGWPIFGIILLVMVIRQTRESLRKSDMPNSSSKCYVTAADYERFWNKKATEPAAMSLPYTGPDRRSGEERRSGGHDRRWEACKGRRFGQRRRRA